MFFSILAIIGKLLFTILKILLFLFLLAVIIISLVFFVPVRYRAAGKYYENETEFITNISWLMHIISLRVESDGSKFSYTLRVFGKKLRLSKGSKRKEKKVKGHKNKKIINKKAELKKSAVSKNGKDNAEPEKAENMDERLVVQSQNTQNIDGHIKTIPENVKDEYDKTDDVNDKNIQSVSENENKSEKIVEEKNIFSKIFSIIKKIPQFFTKAADAIKNFINTVKKMWSAINSGKEKAVLVKEFVFGHDCLDFVCVVKDNVLHLWRHIKPKIVKVEMTIGFDDPAVTGQMLGAIAAFCGAAGIMPCVTPDFEKRVFKGEIEIKGRVTVFVLLKILIKVYFSEELKGFKKSYKSIREVL